MTERWILAIDPGKSTGYAWGYYTESSPYRRMLVDQIEGGVEGFIRFWKDEYRHLTRNLGPITVIFEQFVLLNSNIVPDVEPLKIEGAIRYGLPRRDTLVLQRASAQLLTGGETPAKRKKNSNQLLKDRGLWVTGKDVGCKDADDVISATKHALHYMVTSLKHEPTIDWLYPESRITH